MQASGRMPAYRGRNVALAGLLLYLQNNDPKAKPTLKTACDTLKLCTGSVRRSVRALEKWGGFAVEEKEKKNVTFSFPSTRHYYEKS
jgi:hypothetical protein